MGATREFLEDLFAKEKTNEIEFRGKCHDCGKAVSILVRIEEDGKLDVSGGAIWYVEKIYGKCDRCFEKNPQLTNFRECEVYSRITGYMRPVHQWNAGKKEEYKMRRTFRV